MGGRRDQRQGARRDEEPIGDTPAVRHTHTEPEENSGGTARDSHPVEEESGGWHPGAEQAVEAALEARLNAKFAALQMAGEASENRLHKKIGAD